MSPADLPSRDTRGPMPVAQCGPIADLTARAQAATRISRDLLARLPAPLRDHVNFAGLRNDQLLLLVDSSGWATRARMDQTRVLAVARELGLAARTLIAKVAPRPPSPMGPTTARSLPTRDGPAIRNAAAAIADPELRSLFLELAALAESSVTERPLKDNPAQPSAG